MKTVALIISAILVFAPIALADPPAARTLTLEGTEGVWLRLDLARDALGCMDAREPLARQLRLQTADIVLRERNELRLRADYTTAVMRTTELERELRRPRRNPWIWLSVGLVLGGAGVITAVVMR